MLKRRLAGVAKIWGWEQSNRPKCVITPRMCWAQLKGGQAPYEESAGSSLLFRVLLKDVIVFGVVSVQRLIVEEYRNIDMMLGVTYEAYYQRSPSS